jgi:hypothetical protein
VLRGRGPGASGFESHRRGRIFSKEGTSAGPWMCVCLSGADGRVVEGRATLFRHHREVSRVRIPGQKGLPWMLCVVVSSRKRRRERVGVGSRGKYPGAPPHHIKGKMRKTSRPRIKDTPLSRNTIKERILKLAGNVTDQQKKLH